RPAVRYCCATQLVSTLYHDSPYIKIRAARRDESGFTNGEMCGYRSKRRFTVVSLRGNCPQLRLRTRIKRPLANGFAVLVSKLAVTDCRIFSESKNNKTQRIRSIAIDFLHSLIFPRRHN